LKSTRHFVRYFGLRVNRSFFWQDNLPIFQNLLAAASLFLLLARLLLG